MNAAGHSGIVTGLRGGVASVRMIARPACERCAEGRGCGAGLIRFSPDREYRLQAIVDVSPLPAVGDRVAVECRYPGVTHAAALAYGLPLLAFIGAVLLTGAAAPGQPLIAAAAGIAAMLLSTVAARRLAKRSRPQWVVRAGVGTGDETPSAVIARD